MGPETSTDNIDLQPLSIEPATAQTQPPVASLEHATSSQEPTFVTASTREYTNEELALQHASHIQQVPTSPQSPQSPIHASPSQPRIARATTSRVTKKFSVARDNTFALSRTGTLADNRGSMTPTRSSALGKTAPIITSPPPERDS